MTKSGDERATSFGFVSLVGAGPGDPLLLTRRGLELLETADVVVYDHLASPRLLELAPAGAIRIAAGKSIGHKTLGQDEINAILAEHALLGRRVVRLKGGDPYLFGRGGEEAEHLADRGIPFEVVPGVTSGLGATAFAGIAVTHREAASAVAFVTGHDDPNNVGRLDWPALARFPGTLVIYMGVTRLRRLCATLIAGGKSSSTPAAMIESGTLPHQRVVEATLSTLPDRAVAAQIGFPALLVVGDVVTRRSRLNWFESLPLFGQRILMTRPTETVAESARRLETLGAEVLSTPMVEIRPVEDFDPLDAALGRLESFDWLIFTSANGVRHFLDRLLATGRDLRALGGIRIAAIGPATVQSLTTYRLNADLIPAQHSSEGLIAALRSLVQGQRILLARADRGRTLLPEQLGKLAEVETLTVYRNVDATQITQVVLERIVARSIDWITLTSPAIAERLFGLLSPDQRTSINDGIRLATISALTSKTVRDLGWQVAAEAKVATWEGIVEAILDANGRR